MLREIRNSEAGDVAAAAVEVAMGHNSSIVRGRLFVAIMAPQ
jgi:hypothetical protein